MRFGIVYSLDVGADTNLREFAPSRKQMHLFRVTEDNSRESVASDILPKHRKYASKRLLTQQEFEDFVDHTGLFAEDTETMGILGAPWSEVAFHCPAISFTNDDPHAWQSAYVIPVPERSLPPKSEERTERVWKLVKKAVVNKFRSYPSEVNRVARGVRYDKKCKAERKALGYE
jgi:hypothetical protein